MHASMAWRNAYFNYGISGLCKIKKKEKYWFNVISQISSGAGIE